MAFDFNSSNPEPTPKQYDIHGSKNLGFQNRPEVKNGSSFTIPTGNIDISNRRKNTKTPRRPSIRQRSIGSTSNLQVPWGLLFIIFGIVLAVTCLWIFREVISAFLIQVLTWVITLLVIIFLIKWFIFPKKRR